MNQTVSSRILKTFSNAWEIFMDEYLDYLLVFLPSVLVFLVPIVLSIFDIISTSTAFIVSTIGWIMVSRQCWSFECWRASGTRGYFINPCGPTRSRWINMSWSLFGPFLLFANMIVRLERRLK